MGRIIFTNVSPKALGGIRRVYETNMGARVRAIIGPTGEAVVEVEHPSIDAEPTRSRRKGEPATEAA